MIYLAQATQPWVSENTSFILSIVSLVVTAILGVGAVWLSIVFYRWSTEAEKEAVKASRDISAAVDRLEKLFDKLHSETFTLMKDIVTDMRASAFPPAAKRKPTTRRSAATEDSAEDPQQPSVDSSTPSTGIEAAPASEEEEGPKNG
jgi:cytoskeletal protein RodZ